ncbi:MAG: DUF362 domain-containing protein [Actinobacteria bacterium]|nr:MAG: DUF362 domain-containing protein [Actinomycetota bacterium]
MMNANRSIVSIVKGSDADRMVEEALEHLGGVDSLFEPGATVVIKPNAGHVYPPESAVNTSPEVVRAAIKALRKGNPREIIVAEASAIGCDTMECLEASGIKKAAEEAGADRIIDIKSETDLVDIPIPGARSDIKEVKLPRFLVDADFIVNLPIFKSHVSMVFSCALKNIKGVVQDMVHGLMHFTDLPAAMMDLWSVIDVDLTIADLVRPMEGFGPHCGTPVDFGCVVAGADPVALDATACRMVGLDTGKVDYFKAAIERGMGNVDEELIEIRGNTIEEVHKPIYLPYLEGFGAWPEYEIYAENACSTCQGLIAYTMVRMQAFGEYDRNAGAQIVIGRKKGIPKELRPGKDLILVGDCLKPLKKKIEKAGGECLFAVGCPPLELFPYWALRDRVDQPRPEMLADEDLREKVRIEVEDENARFLTWLRKREV